MDLRPTYQWLKKLWTVDHLNLTQWFKEGLTSPNADPNLDFFGRPINH